MEKLLLLILLIPNILHAQDSNNPINPNSATLMAQFNKEYIATVNQKRAETGLAPLVVSDSLTKQATHYVNILVGVEKGDVPNGNVDHYFAGMGSPGSEITVQDIIKAHWLGSGDGLFPGIKPHYKQIGIASILRKDDLLNYVIFE